jgi:hypothetical protein
VQNNLRWGAQRLAPSLAAVCCFGCRHARCGIVEECQSGEAILPLEVVIHASHDLHCKCLSQFGTDIDSGLPYIYPFEQVVCPLGEQVLIKVVWIVTHKRTNIQEQWAARTESCLVWRCVIFVITCWHLALSLVFLSVPWTRLLPWSHSSKNSVMSWTIMEAVHDWLVSVISVIAQVLVLEALPLHGKLSVEKLWPADGGSK